MNLDVRKEFAADRRRYAAAMLPDDKSITANLSGMNLEAQITKDYHRIEKGLALQQPRRPFGLEVQRRLEKLLPAADPDAEYVQHARTALTALQQWNAGGGVSEDISPLRDIPSQPALPDPDSFFGTRHSVRDFSARPVDPALLERAVELALFSPSVCNRQSWRVHIRQGEEARRVLEFQNGSAGFRDIVPAVVVITVDARAFAGAKERNQGWIDGGIFAMSLVWALHALGLDSCMLNMSVPTFKADALRRHLNADDSELVIMMVAVGHGREGHRRARSPRRGTASVIATAGGA
ncbi:MULTISPECIES: nitroreductase family protein [Microbacterium]|uniref:nitroreductase family protein n=1 Tax=Microbacterium TaxID=33882 RepID=UPI001D1748AA|nr:nitroreductase family protein [Microbacterium testaceum]MCC4248615.1 nitroreductase family protein [Microbacterium testaceum]